jgi:hypothetical protein
MSDGEVWSAAQLLESGEGSSDGQCRESKHPKCVDKCSIEKPDQMIVRPREQVIFKIFLQFNFLFFSSPASDSFNTT